MTGYGQEGRDTQEGREGKLNKVNLRDKLALISEHWRPRIVGALNGQEVKLVKFQGEFVWHHHAAEDELFLGIHGTFTVEFRDHAVDVGPGEMIVVPSMRLAGTSDSTIQRTRLPIEMRSAAAAALQSVRADWLQASSCGLRIAMAHAQVSAAKTA